MLPAALAADLRQHLARRQILFRDDQAKGKNEVFLPDALARKYPSAPFEWGWQYVFASGCYSVDPRSGHERRHHVDEKLLQRAMKKAVKAAGIAKMATPHTLRHYAEPRTMPSEAAVYLMACKLGLLSRHSLGFDSHSCLRKASSWSSGRKRPGATSGGVVRARAFSLMTRSASR